MGSNASPPPSPDSAPDFSQLKRWLQALLLAVPLLCVAAWLVTSFSWPLVGDTALMHYAVFLMQHGFAPYRQIIEMNMPGSYFAEYLAMHLFGPGAHGARLFDFSLLAAAALSMLAIVRPLPLRRSPYPSPLGSGALYAAIFAAAIFALLHARDGMAQANQRDLIVAVLWLAAIAFLFASLQESPAPLHSPRFQLLFAAAFGFCASASLTLKPTTAPFLLVFLVTGALRSRALSASAARWLSASLAGAVLPLAAVLLFLLHAHSLSAFADTVLYLDRFHRHLDAPSLYLVLGAMVPSFLRPVLLVWVIACIALKRWRPWPGRFNYSCLLAAAALGFASYLLQWKGFPYHRYPAFAFLLLVISIDFTAALRARDRWLPVVGVAGLGLLALSVAPRSLIHADSYDNRPQLFVEDLKSDLIALPASSVPGLSLTGLNLDRNIQCLDMFAGCVNALYDLRLLPATGMFYDCYLFSPHQTPYTLKMRQAFLAEISARPPQVIVLTSQLCFLGPHGFNKVDNWPAFSSFLSNRYSIAKERTPEPNARYWDPPEVPYSYRIYALR